MNADAFRHLYAYHFSENQKLWSLLARLPYEQFIQDVPYSIGSLRQQVVHLMSVDEAWFCELRGVEPLPAYRPTAKDDRAVIRARWDTIEAQMRAYLEQLQDTALFNQPIVEPAEDKDLTVWQVLIHVVNHGTDHRAQMLRALHDFGVETTSQDYIFFAYETQYAIRNT
jgi:uncharacterized damage-inducible protein DinB